MSQTFHCPKCPASISVPVESVVDIFLRTSGWTRSAPLAHRETIRLGSGRTATVTTDAVETDAGAWHCSVSHALQTLHHREREGSDMSYDASRDGGARCRPAATPPGPPSGPIRRACPTCGHSVEMAHGHGRDALEAHGFVGVEGRWFCSRRCALLRRPEVPTVAPVEAIADVSYQRRRAELTAQATAATKGARR